MNVKVLIDAIVRQTMVLVAQLATTAGVRAPLAHVANQVFLQLVDELEGQGVRQKVIADMFGLALRSYQRKVQRLMASESEQGRRVADRRRSAPPRWEILDCPPDDGGGDPPVTCGSGDCGPAPGMPNYLCPDGETVGGPACEPFEDGTCGWVIVDCPD